MNTDNDTPEHHYYTRLYRKNYGTRSYKEHVIKFNDYDKEHRDVIVFNIVTLKYFLIRQLSYDDIKDFIDSKKLFNPILVAGTTEKNIRIKIFLEIPLRTILSYVHHKKKKYLNNNEKNSIFNNNVLITQKRFYLNQQLKTYKQNIQDKYKCIDNISSELLSLKTVITIRDEEKALEKEKKLLYYEPVQDTKEDTVKNATNRQYIIKKLKKDYFDNKFEIHRMEREIERIEKEHRHITEQYCNGVYRLLVNIIYAQSNVFKGYRENQYIIEIDNSQVITFMVHPIIFTKDSDRTNDIQNIIRSTCVEYHNFYISKLCVYFIIFWDKIDISTIELAINVYFDTVTRARLQCCNYTTKDNKEHSLLYMYSYIQ